MYSNQPVYYNQPTYYQQPGYYNQVTFDPSYIPSGVVVTPFTDYQPQFTYTHGGLFVPLVLKNLGLAQGVPAQPQIYVNDNSQFELPSYLHNSSDIPSPNRNRIKHIDGRLCGLTPSNRNIGIDFWNIVLYDKKCSKEQFLNKIDVALASIVLLIRNLLKYNNKVNVVMHNKCPHLTGPIVRHILLKFADAKSNLSIMVYIGPISNGDDLALLKFAEEEQDYIIISNDNFNKDEDQFDVPAADIRTYTYETLCKNSNTRTTHKKRIF